MNPLYCRSSERNRECNVHPPVRSNFGAGRHAVRVTPLTCRMRFENDQVWSALKPGSQIVTMLWGGEGPLMVAYSKVGALGARHLAALGVFFLVAACATIEGGPHRLYTVDQEVGEAQVELPTLLGYYYKAGAGSDAQKY